MSQKGILVHNEPLFLSGPHREMSENARPNRGTSLLLEVFGKCSCGISCGFVNFLIQNTGKSTPHSDRLRLQDSLWRNAPYETLTRHGDNHCLSIKRAISSGAGQVHHVLTLRNQRSASKGGLVGCHRVRSWALFRTEALKMFSEAKQLTVLLRGHCSSLMIWSEILIDQWNDLQPPRLFSPGNGSLHRLKKHF